MEFKVSVKTSQVDDHIRERVERRLYFTLGRFQRRIERVHVRLEDTNGPKGGVDQRCRIVVRLHGLRNVVIDQLDANIYAALNRATYRAGRTVARRLDRPWRPKV